ncbi:MAG: mercury resistance system transport protein MerF [Limimaricola soesokkakensis]|uniref:mercury resistance system transport protein MerF n=1 Tax=Limimaricola soesokkakensis TaxID=1343159 RepID=UPI004059508F
MRQGLDQADRRYAEPASRAHANRLLKGGLGGAAFAALCCFTPLLVVVLTGAGLSAAIGGLDYLLFPLLFVSLAVVAQALWLRADRAGPSPKVWATVIAVLLSALIIALEFRGALTLTLVAAALTAAYAFYLNRKSKEVQP